MLDCSHGCHPSESHLTILKLSYPSRAKRKSFVIMKLRSPSPFVGLFVLALTLFGTRFAGLAQVPAPGSALNLDGTSGYAQVTNGVWFNGNFTVEGWVFVRSYNNWSHLIDFANGPNTNNVFLALSGGTGGFPAFGVYTNNNSSPNFSAASAFQRRFYRLAVN